MVNVSGLGVLGLGWRRAHTPSYEGDDSGVNLDPEADPELLTHAGSQTPKTLNFFLWLYQARIRRT